MSGLVGCTSREAARRKPLKSQHFPASGSRVIPLYTITHRLPSTHAGLLGWGSHQTLEKKNIKKGKKKIEYCHELIKINQVNVK